MDATTVPSTAVPSTTPSSASASAGSASRASASCSSHSCRATANTLGTWCYTGPHLDTTVTVVQLGRADLRVGVLGRHGPVAERIAGGVGDRAAPERPRRNLHANAL